MNGRNGIGRAGGQKADVFNAGGYGRHDFQLAVKGGRGPAVTLEEVVAWIAADVSHRFKRIGTSNTTWCKPFGRDGTFSADTCGWEELRMNKHA